MLSLFSILAGVFFILNVAFFNEQIIRAQQFQAFDFLESWNLNDNLIAEFYGTMSVVLLFLIPGITMGLFTSEKSQGTQEMLMTSPLSIWDMVLGKFLAGAAFAALLVALVGLFPGILFLYGDPDVGGGPEIGKTLSGLLGLLLVAWTYVAIGVFASSITRSQVVAFLITFVLLLCMLLLPAIADLGVAGAGAALRWLSTGEHFESLVRGLVDTADLAYFAVTIGAFLLLTHAAVESVRWR